MLSLVLVSHFCIWVTGFQPSSWLFITTMMILCPALIAPPMIYFYAKALHEVARQRRALQEANTKLEAALGEVRELSGLLPICAWCDKVRDDEGYWNRVDAFLKKTPAPKSPIASVPPADHSSSPRSYRKIRIPRPEAQAGTSGFKRAETVRHMAAGLDATVNHLER